MPFFEYYQNNSGGHNVIDEAAGIGKSVIIEAEDADAANAVAESLGLYWNGVEEGMDCDCCGDRWNETYGVGDDEPAIYGVPVAKFAGEGANSWHLPIFVHYANGKVDGYGVGAGKSR